MSKAFNPSKKKDTAVGARHANWNSIQKPLDDIGANPQKADGLKIIFPGRGVINVGLNIPTLSFCLRGNAPTAKSKRDGKAVGMSSFFISKALENGNGLGSWSMENDRNSPPFAGIPSAISD